MCNYRKKLNTKFEYLRTVEYLYATRPEILPHDIQTNTFTKTFITETIQTDDMLKLQIKLMVQDQSHKLNIKYFIIYFSLLPSMGHVYIIYQSLYPSDCLFILCNPVKGP